MKDLMGDMLGRREETMKSWQKVNTNESRSSEKETWRDFGWTVGFRGTPKTTLLVKEAKTGEVYSLSDISDSTITLIDGRRFRLSEAFLGDAPEFLLLSSAQEPVEFDMSEGIVPDTSKDSEEEVIRKLDEAPEGKPRKLGSGGPAPNLDDEREENADLEGNMDAEDDFTTSPSDPGMDDEEAKPITDEPKTGDVEKEYLGKLDDTHYYFVTQMGDEDSIDDLQVVDQEGAVQLSAKEKGIEITDDPADFIKIAYQELEIEDIARDVFLKYLLPKMEQQIETEEEDLDIPLETPDGEEEFPEEEKGAPPLESISIKHEGKTYPVREAKNGIFICENFFSLSNELMDLYKKDGGIKRLAMKAMQTLEESQLKSLKEYDEVIDGDRQNQEPGDYEVTFVDGGKQIVRGARNRVDAMNKARGLNPTRPVQVNPVSTSDLEEDGEELNWKPWQRDKENEPDKETSRRDAEAEQTSSIRKKAFPKEELEEAVDYATLPREYLAKILKIMKSSNHEMTPDHDNIVAELEKALASKDALSGGLADEEGTTSRDVDPEQLRMGVAVELEHTPNKKIAKEIALDHLTEDPEYYTKLKAMEGK